MPCVAVGAVDLRSQRSVGNDCAPLNARLVVWKAKAAIDLRAMFTAPFSIH